MNCYQKVFEILKTPFGKLLSSKIKKFFKYCNYNDATIDFKKLYENNKTSIDRIKKTKKYCKINFTI